MGKVITIAGQRGGTGKSVTAVNLATSLALFEKNTLLIDCDPKGCSTQLSGISDMDFNCDMSTVLSAKARLKDAIYKTEFNCLDMIPSSLNLFQAALKMSRTPGNEKALGLLLKDVDQDYDYIIIDTPSAFDFLSISAMAAADQLLVCMVPELSSSDDFNSLLKLVRYIQSAHHVSVKITGVLFNRSGDRALIKQFIQEQKLNDMEPLVLKTHIPKDPAIQTAVQQNIPVVLKDVKSPAAQAYLEAAEEIHSFFNERGL